MSYSEIAVLLDTLAQMTQAPAELDDAIAVNWFVRCLEVHSLVVVAKARLDADLDQMFAQMAAQFEEQQDAQADLLSAHWGHD